MYLLIEKVWSVYQRTIIQVKCTIVMHVHAIYVLFYNNNKWYFKQTFFNVISFFLQWYMYLYYIKKKVYVWILGDGGVSMKIHLFFLLKWFVVKRQIFESCNYSKQCNGTENANVCKEYGGKMLCYCAHGYLEDKGVCKQGNCIDYRKAV